MKRVLTILTLMIWSVSCQHSSVSDLPFSVQGIDVSRYQQRINWQTVAQQDVQFAFVKATEGAQHRDTSFAYNWAELEKTSLYRGAYHFFSPTVAVPEQIRNFKETVQLLPGDLPPVLDVETIETSSRQELRLNVLTWLQAIESHYKVRPIVYTNQTFYYRYLMGYVDDYPLWIARYHTREPQLEVNQEWDFWQYTNRGQLEGISGAVDLNAFAGSLDQLEALCIPRVKNLTFCGQ